MLPASICICVNVFLSVNETEINFHRVVVAKFENLQCECRTTVTAVIPCQFSRALKPILAVYIRVNYTLYTLVLAFCRNSNRLTDPFGARGPRPAREQMVTQLYGWNSHGSQNTKDTNTNIQTQCWILDNIGYKRVRSSVLEKLTFFVDTRLRRNFAGSFNSIVYRLRVPRPYIYI